MGGDVTETGGGAPRLSGKKVKTKLAITVAAMIPVILGDNTTFETEIMRNAEASMPIILSLLTLPLGRHRHSLCMNPAEDQ